MLTVTVKMKVNPKKHLEFQQTITALLEEIETSGDCLGWNLFREMQNENCYCIETRWEKNETVQRHLSSKRFKIMKGEIRNLCDPPSGELMLAQSLEEKII